MMTRMEIQRHGYASYDCNIQKRYENEKHLSKVLIPMRLREQNSRTIKCCRDDNTQFLDEKAKTKMKILFDKYMVMDLVNSEEDKLLYVIVVCEAKLNHLNREEEMKYRGRRGRERREQMKLRGIERSVRAHCDDHDAAALVYLYPLLKVQRTKARADRAEIPSSVASKACDQDLGKKRSLYRGNLCFCPRVGRPLESRVGTSGSAY